MCEQDTTGAYISPAGFIPYVPPTLPFDDAAHFARPRGKWGLRGEAAMQRVAHKGLHAAAWHVQERSGEAGAAAVTSAKLALPNAALSPAATAACGMERPLPRPDPKLECLGLPTLAEVSGVAPVATNLLQTARIGVQHALLRISDCALKRALGKVSFYALLVGPDAARDTILWSLGMPSVFV